MDTKVVNHHYFLQRKFNRQIAKQYCLQKRLYTELLTILAEKKLTTVYQPIVSVCSGAIIGHEALNRPEATNLFRSTEQFYEFLGETDQIFQFEKLTRQQSIERFVQQRNENNNKNLIFLNVHPQVLNDANYKSGETLHFVKKYGLHPSQIVFEITEKHAVQDYSVLEKVLTNYRSQGFKIAIDDVGAGYNSLKTMMYIKPDFIKLDRSFIQNIDMEKARQNLVHLFVQYAMQSNSKVIAEGVERVEEFQFLKSLHVDFAQGYYIGRPSEFLNKGPT